MALNTTRQVAGESPSEYDTRVMANASRLLPALLQDLRGTSAGGTGHSGGMGTSAKSGRAERTGPGSFLMEDLVRGGIGAKGARDLK